MRFEEMRPTYHFTLLDASSVSSFQTQDYTKIFLLNPLIRKKKNDEKIRERIEEDRPIQSQAYKQRFIHHMP